MARDGTTTVAEAGMQTCALVLLTVLKPVLFGMFVGAGSSSIAEGTMPAAMNSVSNMFFFLKSSAAYIAVA